MHGYAMYDAYCRFLIDSGSTIEQYSRIQVRSVAVDHRIPCPCGFCEDDIVFPMALTTQPTLMNVASGTRQAHGEAMRKSRHRQKTIEALVKDFDLAIEKQLKHSSSVRLILNRTVTLIIRGDHIE